MLPETELQAGSCQGGTEQIDADMLSRAYTELCQEAAKHTGLDTGTRVSSLILGFEMSYYVTTP